MEIWKVLFPSLPLTPRVTTDAEMAEDFLAGCPTQRYLGQIGNVLSLLSAQFQTAQSSKSKGALRCGVTVRMCVARRGQRTVLAWGAQWSRGQNRRRAAAVGRAGFYPRDWGQVLLKTFMIHEPLNLSSERREAPPSPTGLSGYLDLHKWLKRVPRSSLCYMGPFHAGLPRPSWQALISSHKHKEHIFSVLPKQSNKSIQVTPDFT